MKTGVISICLYSIFAVISVSQAENSIDGAGITEQAALVWSENISQKEIVYFSTFSQGKWHDSIQLSNSDVLSFHPAVCFGRDKKIWAVWSIEADGQSLLEYTIFDGTHWKNPILIDTGMGNNKSATIINYPKGNPILAWTSITDKYPDIYWSSWDGEGWSSPQAVHPQNDVPDLEPQLNYDAKGRVILYWKTIRDGQYIETARVFKGGGWHVDSTSRGGSGIKNSQKSDSRLLSEAIEIVKNPRKASINIKDKNGVWSKRLSR